VRAAHYHSADDWGGRARELELPMPVTAAVFQVSAAGCRESTAALPAVGLPLVPYLAVIH